MSSHIDAPTIYFIQTDPPTGPVKIGYTKRRVQDRISEGQTFSANRICVLVETLGTLQDEAKLHRMFEHLRVGQGGGSEWFSYGPEVQDLVFNLVQGGSLQAWLSGV